MSNGTKLALAILALGLGLLLWWGSGSRQRPQASARTESPPSASTLPLGSLNTGADARSQRLPQPIPAPAPTEPGSGPVVEVRGRCVDRDGLPVGDAQVELTELTWWDRDSGVPRTVLAGDKRAASMLLRTRSGADGRFSLDTELPEESPHGAIVTVAARKQGLFRACERKAGVGQSVIDMGDMVLGLGTRVAGFVRDFLGNRCGGVRVSVWQVGRTSSAEDVGDETRSAADGSFALENAPAAPCTLAAMAGDLRRTTLGLDLTSGEPRLDVEVVLPDLHGADSISGMVVDPEDRPVPGAVLHVRTISGPQPRLNLITGCDDHGRFRIEGRPDSTFELVASDRQTRWCGVCASGISSGTHDIVLELDGSRVFTLRVREGSGAPIERFGYERLSTLWPAPVRTEVEPHALGEARLASDVAPFNLRVFAPGHNSCELDTLDPERLPAVVEAVLERACALRGTVLSDGKGVAKARVYLAESRLGEPRLPSHMGMPPAPEALTDVDGHFELTVEGTGTVTLRTRRGADLSPVTGPITVQPGEDVDGLVIEFNQVGAIEGTVLRSDGSPGAALAIAARHEGESVQSTRTDQDGRFRLPGLPEGRYDVTVSLVLAAVHFDTTERPYEGDAQRWSCQVERGRSTRLDIHLLESARVLLTLGLPEAPQSSWRLEMRTRTAGTKGTDLVDRVARVHEPIHVEILDPFEMDLALACDLPGWPRFRMATQTVGRGVRDVSISLRAGRIEGVLAPPFAAGENVSLDWHEAMLSASTTTQADAAGRFVFACAPAGGCLLERGTRPGEKRAVLVKSAETTDVDGL